MPEFDDDFAERSILLADRRNGEVLNEKEGSAATGLSAGSHAGAMGTAGKPAYSCGNEIVNLVKRLNLRGGSIITSKSGEIDADFSSGPEFCRLD